MLVLSSINFYVRAGVKHVFTGRLIYEALITRSRRLRVGWAGTGGRTSSGVVTAYKISSYKFKRLYRFIDFWRRLPGDAFVVKFEHDAFRSATLSLIFYQTGFLTYIILPDGYSIGDKLNFNTLLKSHTNLEKRTFAGCALELNDVVLGSFVFNVELWPFKGAQVCRSAGSFAVVIGKQDEFVTLKLRSGWKIVVSSACVATLGIAPNSKHIFKKLRKAGLRVNLGRRPTVRGVAMNPIDHPHGGGRGKTSGGPKPRSPWGWITKQRKTVSFKKRQLCLSRRFR